MQQWPLARPSLGVRVDADARAFRTILLRLMALVAVATALMLGSAAPALAQGGPQSANILEMQPSELPDTQAERQIKQPGNNAPFWRDVNTPRAYFTTLPQRAHLPHFDRFRVLVRVVRCLLKVGTNNFPPYRA